MQSVSLNNSLKFSRSAWSRRFPYLFIASLMAVGLFLWARPCPAQGTQTAQAVPEFKEKYDLPYSLLADVDKAVCIKYDVLKEKSMYGRKYMGIDRTTFVISPEGKIAAIINGVKPDEHAGAVIAALKGQ